MNLRSVVCIIIIFLLKYIKISYHRFIGVYVINLLHIHIREARSVQSHVGICHAPAAAITPVIDLILTTADITQYLWHTCRHWHTCCHLYTCRYWYTCRHSYTGHHWYTCRYWYTCRHSCTGHHWYTCDRWHICRHWHTCRHWRTFRHWYTCRHWHTCRTDTLVAPIHLRPLTSDIVIATCHTVIVTADTAMLQLLIPVKTIQTYKYQHSILTGTFLTRHE